MFRILKGSGIGYYAYVLKSIQRQTMLEIYNYITDLYPGLISIMVNRLLVGGNLKEKLIKINAIEYILYTFLSLTIYYSILEYVSPFNKLVVFTLLSGVISFAWTIKGRDLAVSFINLINQKFNRNSISIKEFPFEEYFQDNQNHYLSIYKDDKIIAYGFFAGCDSANKILSFVPPKENEIVKYCGLRRSIVFINEGLTINEYYIRIE